MKPIRQLTISTKSKCSYYVWKLLSKKKNWTVFFLAGKNKEINHPPLFCHFSATFLPLFCRGGGIFLYFFRPKKEWREMNSFLVYGFTWIYWMNMWTALRYDANMVRWRHNDWNLVWPRPPHSWTPYMNIRRCSLIHSV